MSVLLAVFSRMLVVCVLLANCLFAAESDAVEKQKLSNDEAEQEYDAAISTGQPLQRLPNTRTYSGCPARLPDSEEEREKEFQRIHGAWPPRAKYYFSGTSSGAATTGVTPPDGSVSVGPGGGAGGGAGAGVGDAWEAYMGRKERAVARVADVGGRWERWLEQVQIRTVPAFTRTGWGLARLPDSLHQDVLSAFRSEHEASGLDSNPEGIFDHDEQGEHDSYVGGKIRMVHLDTALARRVTESVQGIVAEWAGVKGGAAALEPSSTHGTRVYYRGATLRTHVDVVETHVLSAVYVIDREVDSNATGWPMHADPDLQGRAQSIDFGPGRLFLYESAKVPHGRPEPLQGRYSAHVFIHFRPRGWAFSNFDRVYGVPPGWHLPPPGSDDSAEL